MPDILKKIFKKWSEKVKDYKVYIYRKQYIQNKILKCDGLKSNNFLLFYVFYAVI